MAQIPINVGDAHYDPLFEFGFGLTFQGKGFSKGRRVSTRSDSDEI